MRKRLDDENYVADLKPSTATPPTVDANAKVGAKKTAAAIAAEVADKLAASSSSQYIMSSVLSTFAAEEAKSAGFTKSTSINNSNSKTEQPFAVSDRTIYMPAPTINLPSNSPYQTVLVPQPSQIPNSQSQYHTLSNPPVPQYMQPSGGIVTSYAYGSIPSLPPGPPPPPPPLYMMSPMVPLTHQSLQMTQQQQQLTLGHQPLPQQPPPPPSFRPLGPMQPSRMVFYTHPHHSQ